MGIRNDGNICISDERMADSWSNRTTTGVSTKLEFLHIEKSNGEASSTEEEKTNKEDKNKLDGKLKLRKKSSSLTSSHSFKGQLTQMSSNATL